MNKDERIAELEEQLKEAKTQFDIYRSLTIQKQLDSEVVNIIRRRVCQDIRKNSQYNIVGGYYIIDETMLNKLEKAEEER